MWGRAVNTYTRLNLTEPLEQEYVKERETIVPRHCCLKPQTHTYRYTHRFSSNQITDARYDGQRRLSLNHHLRLPSESLIYFE